MTPKEKIDQAILPMCNLLKEQGFKKNGRNFAKLNGDRGSAISVIASRFNSGNSVTFGVSLGVLIPEIAFSRNRKFPNKLTRTDQCSWVTDIGFLLPERNQLSWEVGQASNISSVSKEIVNLVSNIAMPWLSSNIYLEAFLKWLATQPGTIAAELLLRFDRKKEARGCIDISIQEYMRRSKLFPDMFTPEFIAGQKENLQKWLDSHDL